MATPGPRETHTSFLDPAALARLGGLELVARLVVEGFMTGLHHSPYQGFNVEFAEHRQYLPGDDIRHIDWRVYAKSDRFYVKKFEEETNLKAYLVLDVSGSMAFGQKPLSKLDYGRYLTAALTYLVLRQRDSAGLVLLDREIRRYIPPRSQAVHLHAVLSALEEVDPGEPTALGRGLNALSHRLVRRGLIVLISDLLDEPEEVLRALRLLRLRKHEVIVFHVLAPEEMEFPHQEPLLVRDVETGETLPSGGRIQRRYRRAVQQFLEHYRRGCVAHGIDYVFMHTETPFDLALARYLSHRKR